MQQGQSQILITEPLWAQRLKYLLFMKRDAQFDTRELQAKSINVLNNIIGIPLSTSSIIRFFLLKLCFIDQHLYFSRLLGGLDLQYTLLNNI